MSNTTVEQREMVLGQTDGFRYIGFRPPLTQEEVDNLPIPAGHLEYENHILPGVIHEDDGSMTFSFSAERAFHEWENILPGNEGDSLFVHYAHLVAIRLGNMTLDQTVRYLGPGSLFDPANLPAQS